MTWYIYGRARSGITVNSSSRAYQIITLYIYNQDERLRTRSRRVAQVQRWRFNKVSSFIGAGLTPRYKSLRCRKKKKKSRSSTERKDAEVVITESSRAREKEEAEKSRRKEKEGRSDEEGMSEDEDMPKKVTGGRQMTEAERKFEEIQRKRVSLGSQV